MNKMADVAHMFGLELEEEFTLMNGSKIHLTTCCFTKEGLRWLDSITNIWMLDTGALLISILTGNFTVKKKPWKARLSETYYTPNLMNKKGYNETTNDGSKYDDEWYEKGMMCKTVEQAREIAQMTVKIARKMQGFDDDN